MSDFDGDMFGRFRDFIGERALLSLTGGGGKTSLMFGLGRRLAGQARVLTTTTTKICEPSLAETELLSIGEGPGEWEAALKTLNHVTAGASISRGKMNGISPEMLGWVWRRGMADYLIVEADGAKNRPFKGYESHEPVLPPETTHHIVVLGAEVFLRPLSDAIVFRLENLVRRWGLSPGEYIAPNALAAILESEDEYLRNAPADAVRALVVNKCDMMEAGSIDRMSGFLASALTRYNVVAFVSARENCCYKWLECAG